MASKKSKIQEMLSDGVSRGDIAEELETTEQYVSQVKSETDIEEVKSEVGELKDELNGFRSDDDTDTEDDDTFWCSYCEAEGEGQVEVEYLAPECPNGHDLSGDW